MAYIVSYRKTEASAKAIMALRLAAERKLREEEEMRRKAAERVAWEARIAEEAARKAFSDMTKRANVGAAISRHVESGGERVAFRHTYRIIEERALRLFRLTRTEINSNRRHVRVVFARQFIMYWACRLTTLSLPQIGRLMGGRDHSTVFHGRDVYPVKRAKMGRTLRGVR